MGENISEDKVTAGNDSSKLIVALDVKGRKEALKLTEKLAPLGVSFKIGKQLFTAEGPSLVREVAAGGTLVFLDLKFHDIPNTVAAAVNSACRLGVSIVNVHASGGSEMMRAAVTAANEPTDPNGSAPSPSSTFTRPAIIGVTVLTSINRAGLEEIGVFSEVEDQVVRLATLARDAGLDGVVASPREIRAIREKVAAENFLVVVPGVRPEWSAAGDQKRVATPRSAIKDGADYIVVGRPITGDPYPTTAAERVLEEIASA